MFWCGEGSVFGACSTTSSNTTGSSSRSSSMQAQQLQSLCFYQNPEGTSCKPRGSVFFEVVASFSSMVFWCGEGCVLEACRTTSSSSTSSRSSSSSSRQAQQLQSLCLFQNSEGTSSPGAACFLRSFRPSVAWCFGVAKGAFWGLAAPPLAARPAAAAGAAAAIPAAAIALFLLESRRDVKPRGSVFFEVVSSFSSMVFWCGEGCVLEACRTTSSSSTSSSSRSSSSRPSSCNRFIYSRIQKGRQAPGAHVFGGRSILQ